MRYDLVSHSGTRLGEVLLADGVTLNQAGRELVSGRPLRLVPQGDEAPGTVVSIADHKPAAKAIAK
jgi:hypothetical protein